MIVVLDTNILVSAIISPKGKQSQTVSLWFSGRYDLATSNDVVDEYRRVLARDKFRRFRADIPAFLAPFLANRPVWFLPAA